MENPNIQRKNDMSGATLVDKHGPIESIESKKVKGRFFFVAGTIKGYVSPAVASRLDDKSFTENDIWYSEISIDGGKYVPTLMVSNKQNVVRTMGKRA